MIKNFNQFNESLKDIRDKYLEEIRSEIQKEFRPIIEFAHEINDILVNYEDEGFEYKFDQIYCDGGDHEFWFKINLQKDIIEVSDEDILNISQNPDLFYNFVNGDIHFCLEIEWDSQIEQKLIDQVVGMYPFVQDGLVSNWRDEVNFRTFKFKKEDLE